MVDRPGKSATSLFLTQFFSHGSLSWLQERRCFCQITFRGDDGNGHLRMPDEWKTLPACGDEKLFGRVRRFCRCCVLIPRKVIDRLMKRIWFWLTFGDGEWLQTRPEALGQKNRRTNEKSSLLRGEGWVESIEASPKVSQNRVFRQTIRLESLSPSYSPRWIFQ